MTTYLFMKKQSQKESRASQIDVARLAGAGYEWVALAYGLGGAVRVDPWEWAPPIPDTSGVETPAFLTLAGSDLAFAGLALFVECDAFQEELSPTFPVTLCSHGT